MTGPTATVTFLFVDLVGSTDLLHRLGDDANDELTRRYQGIMREAVDRHDGEVLRTMGDGLTVVFEHSVAAGVATAIDMHRAIDRMGRADPLLRLQIRVGLSVGEALRMEGDWSGTPIFEAARLESKARPGTILVNDVIRVLLGNRGGFEFIPVGALELKGFPEPLPAAEVAWEPDPGRPEVPLASALEVGLDWPLVGRDEELARLTGAWAAAAAGRPSQVVVIGEGGTGKTRLAAALAVAVQQGSGDLAGGTVLYGRGGEDPGPPLGPFAEALRWWAASVSPEVLRAAVGEDAAVLAGLVPSLAARLPELLGGAAAADAGRLADAVARVVGRATEATGPWLVIVDAAHAADEATGALAGRLTESDLPVLVVALGRDAGPFDDAERVELAGLDGDATAVLLGEVVARAGGIEVPGEVAARTQAETGGNPRLVIEAGERLVASGALGLAAGGGRDEVVRRAITGVSPYKGLLAYQADDAEDFFGRDTDVGALLGRVAATRLLAVVGASGSGKSSLVRAGLLPALRRGALAGSADWPQVLFNAGPRPLLELAAGVAAAADRPVAEVLTALESGPTGLDTVLGRSPGGPGRVVVVVDQFEEVFTACTDDTERGRFADTLLHAATVPDGRALVVVVLRADFYGHCSELSGLAGALESTTVLLGPMDETALRTVIEGPARRADLSIEPGLTDAMVGDVAGEPGGLPLLSHALYETWERREDRTLTLAGYRDAGGARGAIARTAETVYSTRLDTDQQRIARRLFLDLTELGEGTEDTRRRAQRADLDERAGGADRLGPVLDVLVGSRLVTVGDDTVEVAHEALIREWPRLRDWLDEDRETLRALRHLGAATAEWDSRGRDPADLYRGPRLVAALDAAAGSESDTVPLNAAETAFLTASGDAEDADIRRQRAQNRRLRRLLAGVGVLLVLALIAGAAAYQQRTKANDRTEDADFQRLVSQSLSLAESNPSLAFLLALEANDLRDTPVSRSALFSTLQRQRDFLGYTPTDGTPTGSTLDNDHTLAYGTNEATFGFVDLDTGRPAADTIALGDPPDADIHVFVADDESRGRTDPIIAARADTGQIFRIDPRGNRLIGDPIDNDQAVLALAASARLGLIAVGREDGTVALYDLDTGEAAGFLPAQDDPTVVPASVLAEGATIDDGDPIAVAFSPVDRRLAVERPDSSVEFWDPDTGELDTASEAQDVVYEPQSGTLAYRPDGRQVFAFSYATDDVFIGVDAHSGASDWSLFASGLFPDAVYSGDGRSLFVAGSGGGVVTLDPASGLFESTLVESGVGGLVAFDMAGDGNRVVLTSGASPVAGQWAVDGDGPLLTTFGQVGEFPFGMAPDSDTVLLTSFDTGQWSVWDPQTGEALVPDLPIALGGYVDDRILVAFFVDDLTAGLYDIDRQQRIPPRFDIAPAGVNGGIINAEADLLALGHEDGTVEFYDRTGTQPYPSVRVDGSAWVQALNRDATLVLVVDSSGSGTVFDVHTGEVVAGPIRDVGAAEFSSADETILVGTLDGRISELDLPTLDPVGAPFPQLSSGLVDMTATDDQTLISFVTKDRRLQVFDVAARAQIGDDIVLGAQGGNDPSLDGFGDIAHDGTYVVVSGERSVETWDLVPGHWRDIACRLAGRNLTQEEWDTYLPNGGSYQRTCPEWPAGA